MFGSRNYWKYFLSTSCITGTICNAIRNVCNAFIFTLSGQLQIAEIIGTSAKLKPAKPEKELDLRAIWVNSWAETGSISDIEA